MARIWDARKLQAMKHGSASKGENLNDFDQDVVNEYIESPKGKGCLRAEWRHGKSVSAAYWDPRGRSIVSTSYDDLLRSPFCRSCHESSSILTSVFW